jgi:hypothetical protein
MDNKELRAFDQKIHDKLHHVEVSAAFDMWSKISEELDVQEAAAPKVAIRPAQQQSFNWKYVAAASVIAFTFVSSYMFFSGSEADEIQYSASSANYQPGINFAPNAADEPGQITIQVQEPQPVLAVIKETARKQPKKIAVPVENKTVAEEAAVAVNEEYTAAETTNIPMFSLRMSTPQTSLNDQITILSGNEKKVEEDKAVKEMSIKRRIEFYKNLAKFNSWK